MKGTDLPSSRSRISRLRYDRLLQGMQGLILRFQAIADDPATSESTRSKIEDVLRCADQVLNSARQRYERSPPT